MCGLFCLDTTLDCRTGNSAQNLKPDCLAGKGDCGNQASAQELRRPVATGEQILHTNEAECLQLGVFLGWHRACEV